MWHSFASTEAKASWVKSGSPYCEHPDFRRDRGPYGKDYTDWYCPTCGEIWVNKWADQRPEPIGNR